MTVDNSSSQQSYVASDSTRNQESEGASSKRTGVSLFMLKLRSFMNGRGSATLKESVEEIMEEHDAVGDSIDPEERLMLRNVLAFNELAVDDVMIPRSDILTVSEDISFEALKEMLNENVHTRLPVIRETLDDVAGFIHIKDIAALLAGGGEFHMEHLVRQALFVPPSMRLSDLLMRMQLSRVHIAIVVDEYGGTAGMLTLEDMIEEIFGEIEDEHDVEGGDLFMQTATNRFEVSARIEIDELEERLSMDLTPDDEDEDFHTLGGLLSTRLGRIPIVGEVTLIDADEGQLECEILEADPRRIQRVMLRKKMRPADQEVA